MAAIPEEVTMTGEKSSASVAEMAKDAYPFNGPADSDN